MPYRVTTTFALTTAPTQLVDAQPHSGSWSESFWRPAAIDESSWTVFATKRAALLPKQAAIIGYKQQFFTLGGAGLVPGASNAVKKLIPGNNGFDCDVPQMALEISGTSPGVANSSRFTLRGIPDNQVQNGEYTPTPAFKVNLTNLLDWMRSPPAYGFVGRDLTKIPVRVVSIAGSILKTAEPMGGGMGAGGYVRLLKVRGDDGKPVTGAFYCLSFTGPATYELQGLAATVTVANGRARQNGLSFFPFAALNPGRITVKKIGRPSASYRGRASKRR